MSETSSLHRITASVGRHRPWWLAAAGAAVILLVVLVAVVRSGEARLVSQVEERLAERLVAEVTVGRVRPALDGPELHDLTVTAPGGFRLDADEVQAPLDLAGLASDARLPLTVVRLHGVEITLDPRSAETRAWLRDLLGVRGGGEPDGGDGKGEDDRAGSDAGRADGGPGLLSGVDLSAVGVEIGDLTLRLVDAGGEPREVFTGGAFRIDRSAPSGTAIGGGATLAGGGELTVEGNTVGERTEIAVATTDLATRWLRPLLPDGVSLRNGDATRLAGRLDLARGAAGEPWSGSGSVELQGVTVESEELAHEPVRLPRLRLEAADLEISGGEGIALRRGSLDVGAGVTVGLEAAYRPGDGGARYRVEAETPSSPCQGLVDVVPPTLLRNLDVLELDGSYTAGLLLDLDMADLDATRLELSFDDGCLFRRVPERLRAETLRGPFELQVPAAAEGETRRLVTGPGSSRWVPLHAVSRFVRQAVLAHEDAAFHRHHGFAPWAIRNSLVENLEAGRFERGASTISMQLAKNLFLTREKILARKVREVFFTWWLEHRLSKREILALYLNAIEYGPDLYGIGPAARHYFDAHPSRLGPAEAVFLATVLPAPRRYHRDFERGALSTSTEAEMRFLLKHMHRKDRISAEEMEWGLETLDSFRFGRVHPRGSALRRFLGIGDGDGDGELGGR